MANYITQNSLLLNNLLEFYKKDNNLDKMLNIINGESRISLRIVDWFATNYSKSNFSHYLGFFLTDLVWDDLQFFNLFLIVGL